MKFEDITQLLRDNELGGVDHRNGHWTITGGKYIVHFWPYSKRRTIWVEGTKYKCQGDIHRAIAVAKGSVNIPPNLQLPNQPKKQKPRIFCPECGSLMVLRHSQKFNRCFYGCSRYPKCQATHGAHKDGTPLGIPANTETKEWRIKAHAAFDQIWRDSPLTNARQIAYKILADSMAIDVKDCHIGLFDMDECKIVIALQETLRQKFLENLAGKSLTNGV